MRRRPSLLLPLATALVFSCAYCYIGLSLLHLGAFRHYNHLFNADVPRIVGDMTLAEGNHSRVKVHPLFVLLVLPPALLLRSLALFTVHGDDLFLYSPLWTLHLLVWVAVAPRYCRERALPAPGWALPPLTVALLCSNTRFVEQILSVFYRGVQSP